jgi:CDP-diacylglycerol---serine O-phosphatidyltransferase
MAKNAVPTMFTFGNLACGVLSLMMTFQGNFRLACIFIIIAGIFDRYDGRIARFLQVSSDLGKELDSLADLVSFGVAPSILVFNAFNFHNFGIISYILVLIFPLSGAYRLARYNSSTFNNVFMGIPITIAGLFIAFYVLISFNFNLNPDIAIILEILLSYLMVSKLKVKKV